MACEYLEKDSQINENQVDFRKVANDEISYQKHTFTSEQINDILKTKFQSTPIRDESTIVPSYISKDTFVTPISTNRKIRKIQKVQRNISHNESSLLDFNSFLTPLRRSARNRKKISSTFAENNQGVREEYLADRIDFTSTFMIETKTQSKKKRAGENNEILLNATVGSRQEDKIQHVPTSSKDMEKKYQEIKTKARKGNRKQEEKFVEDEYVVEKKSQHNSRSQGNNTKVTNEKFPNLKPQEVKTVRRQRRQREAENFESGKITRKQTELLTSSNPSNDRLEVDIEKNLQELGTNETRQSSESNLKLQDLRNDQHGNRKPNDQSDEIVGTQNFEVKMNKRTRQRNIKEEKFDEDMKKRINHKIYTNEQKQDSLNAVKEVGNEKQSAYSVEKDESFPKSFETVTRKYRRQNMKKRKCDKEVKFIDTLKDTQQSNTTNPIEQNEEESDEKVGNDEIVKSSVNVMKKRKKQKSTEDREEKLKASPSKILKTEKNDSNYENSIQKGIEKSIKRSRITKRGSEEINDIGQEKHIISTRKNECLGSNQLDFELIEDVKKIMVDEKVATERSVDLNLMKSTTVLTRQKRKIIESKITTNLEEREKNQIVKKLEDNELPTENIGSDSSTVKLFDTNAVKESSETRSERVSQQVVDSTLSYSKITRKTRQSAKKKILKLVQDLSVVDKDAQTQGAIANERQFTGQGEEISTVSIETRQIIMKNTVDEEIKIRSATENNKENKVVKQIGDNRRKLKNRNALTEKNNDDTIKTSNVIKITRKKKDSNETIEDHNKRRNLENTEKFDIPKPSVIEQNMSSKGKSLEVIHTENAADIKKGTKHNNRTSKKPRKGVKNKLNVENKVENNSKEPGTTINDDIKLDYSVTRSLRRRLKKDNDTENEEITQINENVFKVMEDKQQVTTRSKRKHLNVNDISVESEVKRITRRKK